ncbi:MAG: DNA repair and recombination protein RadA [Candidatus Heimdallarchaeota archaeon]|nr:DNA repair and recombination protein RadA [Candidatus Heimdallarchaeota archaeon]
MSKKNMFSKYIKESVDVDEEPEQEEYIYNFPLPIKILPWRNNDHQLEEYTQKLVDAGYTKVAMIASATVSELHELTKLPEFLLKQLIENAQMEQSFTFSTAANLFETKQALPKISTMVKSLDAILQGGVEARAITELYGEFISGKTQICLQLAVHTALPREYGGYGSKVIYIDTEGSFSPERVIQICSRWSLDPKIILDNILVGRAYTTDMQIKMLNSITAQIKDHQVKLLIIDSISSNFRAEYMGKEAIYDRQQKLNNHLQQLARLADIHDLAVVITNQVMSTMENDIQLRPVGGNILAHGSTHRIQCSKSKLNSSVRFAQVVASPSLKDAKASYQITDRGIEDI